MPRRTGSTALPLPRGWPKFVRTDGGDAVLSDVRSQRRWSRGDALQRAAKRGFMGRWLVFRSDSRVNHG